jgi:hypothetical protein
MRRLRRVPALVSDLGERVWWPGRLSRAREAVRPIAAEHLAVPAD